MRTIPAILIGLTLTACGADDYSRVNAPDDDARSNSTAIDGAPAASPAPRSAVTDVPKGFVAHEWGTFTSVVGSNGALLDGMHHEEEVLPAFVYGRAPAMAGRKAVEALPEPVNQKMETPVIYFYTPEPQDVTVTVGFPQGVISEWYPNAASFEPQLGALTRIAEGNMTWEVGLAHEEADLVEVAPEDIWAPSREVPAAATVTFGEEQERFIFYRGLARFETPVRVTATDEAVHIHNSAAEDVPAAFLLNVHEGGGTIQALGPVAAGATVTATPSPKERPGAFEDRAAAEIAAALEASGLYRDEALSMVNTWRRSYFGNHGLRVLYILPGKWTDELLPLTIEPVPDEVVRTLVGRVEVLTPAQEREVVEMVEAAHSADDFPLDALGRFTEPKLRRALQLASPETRPLIEDLLASQAFIVP